MPILSGIAVPGFHMAPLRGWILANHGPALPPKVPIVLSGSHGVLSQRFFLTGRS